MRQSRRCAVSTDSSWRSVASLSASSSTLVALGVNGICPEGSCQARGIICSIRWRTVSRRIPCDSSTFAAAPPSSPASSWITRWLATDPATLAQSFLAYIGHPAYGLEALHADLDRFTFLLGGNYGEFLTGQDPP